jgi:hypothetical protein
MFVVLQFNTIMAQPCHHPNNFSQLSCCSPPLPLENQLSEDRGRIICYLLATQPMHTNDRNIGGAGEEKKWKIKNKNPLAAKIT